jgi:hypothetical protein
MGFLEDDATGIGLPRRKLSTLEAGSSPYDKSPMESTDDGVGEPPEDGGDPNRQGDATIPRNPAGEVGPAEPAEQEATSPGRLPPCLEYDHGSDPIG